MPPLCALLRLNRANDEKIPLGGFKPATVIRIPADLWTTPPPLYNWSGCGCVYHWTTTPPPLYNWSGCGCVYHWTTTPPPPL